MIVVGGLELAPCCLLVVYKEIINMLKIGRNMQQGRPAHSYLAASNGGLGRHPSALIHCCHSAA